MLCSRLQKVEPRPCVFQAVPTIYSRLSEHFSRQHAGSSSAEAQVRAACGDAVRLFVCGSAALPTSVLEQWQRQTGHVLLERYGMTETGMLISNTLTSRVPGSVGWPLPGVEARIDPADAQLHVRGPGVFRGYWANPKATGESFDAEGWFATGDAAAVDAGTSGRFKILGRLSSDVIKTGGEKVSALEIERVVLGLPCVAEAAVVGVPDDAWGERVTCVAAVREEHAPPTLEEMRDFCRASLAPYELPSRLILVNALERNAMGKVNKKELVKKIVSGDLH